MNKIDISVAISAIQGKIKIEKIKKFNTNELIYLLGQLDQSLETLKNKVKDEGK